MGIVRLDPTATVNEVVAAIERDGGVVIRDFIAPATVEALLKDLKPKLDASSLGSAFGLHKTSRIGGIFKHTRQADEIVRNPLFHDTAERFLRIPETFWASGKEVQIVPTMHIGVTQMVSINAGEGAQPLHRDDSVWLWRHPEGGGGRQARVQIMIAITDFTAENGGTLVVPGSHLWGDDRGPSMEQAIPTEMSSGSALIFLGSTFHGGGSNNTDQSRIGLTMSFDLGNLRQEENQYLTIPIEQARELPEDIQRMIGYQVCPPGAGYLVIDGEMADAHLALQD